MLCDNCGLRIDNGVIVDGKAYCDRECSEEKRRRRADNQAMAEGFISYEEKADHLGIPVIG